MPKDNIVSQEEMDALMSESGRRIPSLEDVAKEGIPFNFYDFITEYHKTIIRSRRFNAINLNFANELRNDIFRLLRIKSTIETLEPDVISYNKYFEEYDRQAAICMLQVSNTNTYMLISFDKNAIFSVIETLFGGKASNPNKLKRDFSNVDIKVAKLLSEHITSCFKAAWDNTKAFDFQYIKTTTDQILPNRISSNDKVVVQKYKIKLDSTTTEIHICLPYSLIYSVSDLLENEESKGSNIINSDSWYETLTHNIYNSNINISAVVTETELSLKDIANLKTGDVIAIDDPTVGQLLAEGVPVFKVRCGLQEGKKVVEIIKRMDS